MRPKSPVRAIVVVRPNTNIFNIQNIIPRIELHWPQPHDDTDDGRSSTTTITSTSRCLCDGVVCIEWHHVSRTHAHTEGDHCRAGRVPISHDDGICACDVRFTQWRTRGRRHNTRMRMLSSKSVRVRVVRIRNAPEVGAPSMPRTAARWWHGVNVPHIRMSDGTSESNLMAIHCSPLGMQPRVPSHPCHHLLRVRVGSLCGS